MLKIAITGAVLFHGLIHLLGFAKAYRFADLPGLTHPISRRTGLLWAATTLLFVLAIALLLLQKEAWWLVALLAAVLSQVLIAAVWKDAKAGTLVNVLVLLIAVLAFGNWRFEKAYRSDVASRLEAAPGTSNIITEADLAPLPGPVQRYLRYTGVLNKPRVQNFRVTFEGAMRQRGKNWFPFTSEQYNFLDHPTRLFFMKGKIFGVSVPGYHAYRNGEASMDIKLFGLFPAVSESGPALNKAETVTLFNDLCLLAPAALIDKRIAWQLLNDTAAKATFTVAGHSISATLLFNAQGQLVNFISDDRYEVNAKKFLRFSTPVRDYRRFNGYNLPAYGEAVWHYPDGEFVYGKFWLKDVQYNVGK